MDRCPHRAGQRGRLHRRQREDACSTNLRTLAEAAGLTDDANVRQELADLITRERVVAWMGEQIQQAVRRGEMPPMDPGLIKLMTADNRVRSGNMAMQITGRAVSQATVRRRRGARSS